MSRVVLILIFTLFAQSAFADEERGKSRLSYQFNWIPSPTVSIRDHEVRAKINVAGDESNRWFVTVSGSQKTIRSRERLDGKPLPGQLYEVGGGVGYAHRWEARRSLVVSAGANSATDSPRAFGEATSIVSKAVLTLPSGDENSWIFSLRFSSRREPFLVFPKYVPIPGIAYRWKVSDRYTLTIGIPFGELDAEPIDGWTFSARYSPRAQTFGTKVRLMRGLLLFADYRRDGDSYLLSTRTEDEERFIISQQQVVAGVGVHPFSGLGIAVGAGYGWSRSLQVKVVGQGVSDSLRFLPGWFGTARVTLSF